VALKKDGDLNAYPIVICAAQKTLNLKINYDSPFPKRVGDWDCMDCLAGQIRYFGMLTIPQHSNCCVPGCRHKQVQKCAQSSVLPRLFQTIIESKYTSRYLKHSQKNIIQYLDVIFEIYTSKALWVNVRPPCFRWFTHNGTNNWAVDRIYHLQRKKVVKSIKGILPQRWNVTLSQIASKERRKKM
jgi:hypothetical protein